MSNDRHPDLDDLYDRILTGEEIMEEDDLDDGDYELYVDAEDIDEEMDEDDEFYEEDEGGDIYFEEEEDEDDDDDDDEYDDEDQTMRQTHIEEDNDDGEEVSFRELARLFNSAPNADARSSLLARLLAGPGGGDNVPVTRSGPAGLLRRLGAGFSTQSPEERARVARERRKKEQWWTIQEDPHPQGMELLRGGEFGNVGGWKSRSRRRIPSRRIWPERRCLRRSPPISQATIPNTHGTVVAAYPSIPYVGQYAGEDYGVFYTATQYFTLHLYSTTQSRKVTRKTRPEQGRLPTSSPETNRSALRDEEEDYEDDDDDGPSFGLGGQARRGMASEDTSMQKIKTVQGQEGRWTVTDCDADKKGEKMIYSSITPYVHMLYTAEDESDHVCLDFSNNRRREDMFGYSNFGIWSIRFSADGKEVVAGAGGGQIMVYDIEAERRSLAVTGHADDVNAVCFADESSTNILVSGSDDGYVKIWDRRSLSSSTPSGILVGATEGITYTSPKGDGRYIVVNSKDQAARLYDLRKMRSHSQFEHEPDAVARYGQPRYDYRNSRYPPPPRLAHPHDCSVMTYRGHQVLRTLIRCHFSPRESTGQSYIYSGSADGKIHIWSLDGRVVQVLDRAESNPLRAAGGGYNDPSAPDECTPGMPSRRPRRLQSAYDAYEYGSGHCVRDVSWHGFEPTLMSTCWEMEGGYRRGGTLAKHEWKGLGKGGMRNLEDWVEKRKAEMEG